VTRLIGIARTSEAETRAPYRDRRAVSAAAYETFVRQNCAALLKSLTLVSLDPEVAADAAQEAFIQLYKHWEAIRRHDSPEAWLYRVGVNRCKDYRRRLARGARLFRRLVAEVPTPGVPVEWDARDEGLALLGNLPRRQRTAAALFFGADFSVAQVAAVMNISEGAVKSHLARARESLREVLEER
jgi:RNA polymerase sigma factor (sigma-70 family)